MNSPTRRDPPGSKFLSPSPPSPHMVWIPGGTFRMGSDGFYPEERPAHRVTVDGFWMDEHPVTNAAYSRFVQATGYVRGARTCAPPATACATARRPGRARRWTRPRVISVFAASCG